MLTKEELSQHGYSEDEYLLATDNPVIVPVGSVVRMQVTELMFYMLGKYQHSVFIWMQSQVD